MKNIILTGDRPTGRLHLGHLVGSLRQRVELQNSGNYDEIYIEIADAQATTDNAGNIQKVKDNVLEVALDYLSCGIDPKKTTIFLQSQIPELSDLTFYYMNLVTLARLQRNPTVKQEIIYRKFDNSIPVGFMTYPISQASDITAFNANIIPVGDDQLPMIEQTREIVRTFNRLYGETLTMPGSAGSSWYFLRYVDPHNDKIFCDKKLADHWLPVDLYIGGPEHAVGHLIYSRIWTKYLHQKGYISFDEPFQKLVHQGMILGANGIKMGKRYPEFVVNPSDIVKKYGADTLRLYEMFMGPLEASKPWSDQGVEGANRFINRVYRMITECNYVVDEPTPELETIYHQTVKKVTDDYNALAFNTAISQMMIFVNEVYRVGKISKEYAEGFVKLISCITPHIGEEMWEILGHDKTIAFESWPAYDESKTVLNLINIAVSVNGKLRATIKVEKDLDDEALKALAFEQEGVKRNIEGKEIKKVIVVKNKIVNIVAI